ncbi:HNH endonuclease [Planotetraspora sp. A-T 1434]|uniref:HNH endonuclease signature motif containing protein n=1 Tax=Planotetraspora sp. A-T 1434 TaxID=2979219 RepID=UPI0021C0E428|nr:HNH endonuclease signature motif containing protein [Planotetraspora sp. A-T 1434]MCT9930856.1 HNH endonuclease [Planotetraspora sp. A-T 1434]
MQLYGEPFAEVAGVAPGGQAAAGIERALPRLSALPDSQVLDVLAAARRMACWAEAVQLSAAVELHGRPVRDEHGAPLGASRDLVELTQACVVEEIAAKVRVNSGTAAHLVSLGTTLTTRFPEMLALLRCGMVDVPKVLALVNGTALLEEEQARAVQAAVLGVAGELTSAQLRARVNRLALEADPELAERKRREAENRAELRVWRNSENGTATLALIGSPVAWALAASDRVDALARAAKDAGDQRPLPQLRLLVTYTLILGHDPRALAPIATHKHHDHDHDDERRDSMPAPGTGGDPLAGAPVADGTSRHSGSSQEQRSSGGRGGVLGEDEIPWPSAPMPDHADASKSTSTRQATEDGDTKTAEDAGEAGKAGKAGEADGQKWTEVEEIVASADSLTVRRTHWLSVPYATWNGDAELPGELQHFGLVTAAQARDLAARARRWVATRDRNGHIVLHGEIAIKGPARPQLVRIMKAVRAVDQPPPPEPGYRPSAALDAKVRARDRTCRAPSCNHSAWSADLDHTRAHERGGPTAYGNLAALHRRHHRIKGSVPGVHVEQVRPGQLLWRTRTGDTYHTRPA